MARLGRLGYATAEGTIFRGRYLDTARAGGHVMMLLQGGAHECGGSGVRMMSLLLGREASRFACGLSRVLSLLLLSLASSSERYMVSLGRYAKAAIPGTASWFTLGARFAVDPAAAAPVDAAAAAVSEEVFAKVSPPPSAMWLEAAVVVVVVMAARCTRSSQALRIQSLTELVSGTVATSDTSECSFVESTRRC